MFGNNSKEHSLDTPEAEIAFLEKRIADDQLRLSQIHRGAFVEFPKMVKGLVFNSKEEQDKAGHEYADKPEKHAEKPEPKAKKEHA